MGNVYLIITAASESLIHLLGSNTSEVPFSPDQRLDAWTFIFYCELNILNIGHVVSVLYDVISYLSTSPI